MKAHFARAQKGFIVVQGRECVKGVSAFTFVRDVLQYSYSETSADAAEFCTANSEARLQFPQKDETSTGVGITCDAKCIAHILQKFLRWDKCVSRHLPTYNYPQGQPLDAFARSLRF